MKLRVIEYKVRKNSRGALVEVSLRSSTLNGAPVEKQFEITLYGNPAREAYAAISAHGSVVIEFVV